MAWIAPVASLALLNLTVTFRNVWPTLSVRPTAELSVELALVTLGLVLWGWRAGRPSGVALRLLAVGWTLLIVGRYIGVTSEALYGREVNLYWDVRHMPSVGAMFTAVAESWAVAAGVVVAVASPLVLYAQSRWCLGRLAHTAADPSARRWLAVIGVAVEHPLEAAQRCGCVRNSGCLVEVLNEAICALGLLEYERWGS